MERDYLSSLLNLFRKRINKIFVGLLVIIIAACDFENPSDFEVPVWFIDIKLPLVSKRFPMGDLVDTTNFIYPTDDSAGFQILFSGEIDPPVGTEDTDLSVRFANGYLENSVETSIGGFPFFPFPFDLPPVDPTDLLAVLVTYDDYFYPGFKYDEGTGLWDQDDEQLFQIPLGQDYFKLLDGTEVDMIGMRGSVYNEWFVSPVNSLLSGIFSPLNALPISNLPLDEFLAEIGLDMTIDSLVIAGGSYESKFKNHGYPTNLVEFYGLFEHGTFDILSPIAFHGDTVGAGLQSGDSLTSLTSLAGVGLARRFQFRYACELEEADDDEIVVMHRTDDGLMGITYSVEIAITGFDSLKVTMAEVPLDIGSMLTDITDQLSFGSNMPEFDTTTTIEIRSAEMKPEQDNDGNPLLPDYHANKIIISELKSTFPFDIGLLFGLPNFQGGQPVEIDTVLNKAGDPITKVFNLAGTTLEATGDSAIGALELDLAVTILEQEVTIPLGSDILGMFGMKIQFGSLYFSELKAYVFKELTADTMDIAGFPPELTGIGFPGLEFEFELFNEIDLPILLDIFIDGTRPNGTKVSSRITADLGVPGEFEYFDDILCGVEPCTVKTIMRWNDLGTTLLYYAPASSPQATKDTLIEPLPGDTSIIDFFGSMPLTAVADIKARLDGEGGIAASAKKIWGSFTFKLPFAVTMNAPPFIPPTGISKLPEFSPDNRNKIRHSLLESEFATNIENSLPLGGEFAILLSDQPYFPKDITPEALDAFRDTMITQYDWDSTDVLYIVDDCDELNPRLNTDPTLGMTNIYMYDVMEDTSQCVDGMKYLVKHSDLDSVDRVISYVDTLFRIILPSPLEYYSDTSTVGHPGQVLVPGVTGYSSMLDANRIFLLTDYGDRYIVPRFSFNQTGDQTVFFSKYDAIDIKSSITFRVSSGVFGATENDIVILSPNGGENWKEDSVRTIRWKTYGEIYKVDVYYFVDDATEKFPDILPLDIKEWINPATGKQETFYPSDNSWFSIIDTLENVDSLVWNVDIFGSGLQYSDSVRIIIKDSDSEVFDVSGWYFIVSENGLLGGTSMGSAVINRGKLKRPGKSR